MTNSFEFSARGLRKSQVKASFVSTQAQALGQEFQFLSSNKVMRKCAFMNEKLMLKHVAARPLSKAHFSE
jgi:hypothetical protein